MLIGEQFLVSKIKNLVASLHERRILAAHEEDSTGSLKLEYIENLEKKMKLWPQLCKKYQLARRNEL